MKMSLDKNVDWCIILTDNVIKVGYDVVTQYEYLCLWIALHHALIDTKTKIF
jgi:hypothetical protein